MNFHQSTQMRFRHQYQPVKCMLVFFGIALPMLATMVWVRFHSTVLFHILLLTTGWLTWTFFEYMLHRFWMHKKDPAHNRSMSEGHQHHHMHPTELRITALQRIYMLLILTTCGTVSCYLNNYFTFIPGVCIGMSAYMYMHKFLHTKRAGGIFKRLFQFHIYHHCKYPDTCFGTSTTLWDDVFGTLPPKTAAISPRVLTFYLKESN